MLEAEAFIVVQAWFNPAPVNPNKCKLSSPFKGFKKKIIDDSGPIWLQNHLAV